MSHVLLAVLMIRAQCMLFLSIKLDILSAVKHFSKSNSRY